MPKNTALPKKFNIKAWRQRFYNDVRNRLDAMGSRQICPRDNDYLEQHCDLNSVPRIEAEKLMEALLTKAETGVNILPRTKMPSGGRTFLTQKMLAEEYGCSVRTMVALLEGARYASKPRQKGRKAMFTFEEAEAIRARYRAVKPYKPKQPRIKKAGRTYKKRKKQEQANKIAVHYPMINTEND